MIKTIYLNAVLLCACIYGCGQNTQESVESGFVKKADAYMKAITNRTAFSGTVLIAKGDDIIFNKGYGLASRRFSIPNDENTKYRIGSMTKSFTAVLLLQQMERGKISLDDYLEEYIPEYPFSDQIQIKHLLSHTSGIKRDIKFPDETTVWSMEELINFSKVDSLLYEPGTKMTYSNCGYILLHHILEKVTGKTYRDLLNAEILSKLNMTNTGIEDPTLPPSNFADGFGAGINEKGTFSQIERNLISHGYSDAVGALYSTTTDLLKFCREIGKPGLLEKKTWDMAITPFDAETRYYHWGYGFNVIMREDKNVVNHNGRTTGFRGGYFYERNSDMTIIILANNADASRESIVGAIFKMDSGEEYYQPKMIEPVSTQPDLEKYIGNYKTESFPFEIKLIDGSLHVSSHGDAPAELVAVGNDSFYCKFFDLNLHFKEDGDEINGCDWEYQGKTETGKRL